MTCKDCLNYEDCKKYGIEPFDDNDNEKDFCVLFKDKSRFIELPCNVGDKAYYIYDNKQICETKVDSITIESILAYKYKIRFTSIFAHDLYVNSDFTYHNKFNENSYLKKEEAEKELTKRKVQEK